MRCYRLCEPRYRALDGAGARKFGGRWNPPGFPVVYTSVTRSLAALELLVHFDVNRAPDGFLLLALEIPDSARPVPASIGDLPEGWQNEMASPACQRLGKQWLTTGRDLVLAVPSIVVPEEVNLLLNPRHPAFVGVAVAAERRFSFDPRLRAGR